MRTQFYYCPDCYKMTRQIELTASEYGAMSGHSAFMRFCDVVGGDYLRMKDVANMVLQQNKWKCCNCGLGTVRKPDGEIEWCFKDGIKFIYDNSGHKSFFLRHI